MSYCTICGKPKVVVPSGRYCAVTGHPEYEEKCEHPCHIHGNEVHHWKVKGFFNLTSTCKRCGIKSNW